MSTLPNKPSALIRLALHDLQMVSEHPDYVINMDIYHNRFGKKCGVCLAGSVMAATLQAPFKWVLPMDTPYETQLRALDILRRGDVALALGLGYQNGSKYDRHITPYEEHSAEFVDDMNKLADDLEADGY